MPLSNRDTDKTCQEPRSSQQQLPLSPPLPKIPQVIILPSDYHEPKEDDEIEEIEAKEELDPFKRYFNWINILLIVFSLCISGFFIFEPQIVAYFWKVYSPEETPEYILNLKTCKIPALFDGQSPLPFMWEVDVSKTGNLARVDLKCQSVDQFSQVEDDKKLYLMTKMKKRKCCIRNITRPDNMETDSYKVSSSCRDFTANGTDISGTEFLIIQCIHQRNKSVDFNTHALLPNKPSVMEKVSHWNSRYNKDEDLPLSVAVIVIGSTSRAHAHRSLPATMEYLESPDIGFTLMNGYQSMEEDNASSTLAYSNILPLLTGKADLGWGAKFTTRWDNFTMLWNKFSDEKYVTMFMDDSRKMLRTASHVNSRENGKHKAFRKQPTDYYLKPFLEAHSEAIDAFFPNKRTAKRHCIGKRTLPSFLLSHLLRFHKKFEKIPTFSFTYLSWPQQQHGLEALSKMDETYLDFFQDFFDIPSTLDRTAVVVMSDHGDIHHPYYNTEHGSQEKLNPLLMIRLPQNLVNRHPKYLENLETNSHRIISPLDVHRTISLFSKLFIKKSNPVHFIPAIMANYNVPATGSAVNTEKPVGRNLFTGEIPYRRTCAEAKIPEAMCLCNRSIPSSYNGRSIVSAENGKPEKCWKYSVLPQE